MDVVTCFRLLSSYHAEAKQASGRASQERQHADVQLFQLQRFAASGPVSTSHAQQTDCRTQRGRSCPAAEYGRQQTHHVLRKCPARPSQTQTPARTGKKE